MKKSLVSLLLNPPSIKSSLGFTLFNHMGPFSGEPIS
ncbi:hypothetical protein KEN51_CDS0337 [Pseudomonas phage vB_Pae10145-KEN51]|nr:hypothetical protein [Pseudomonas phage ANB1]WNV50079.1 hypothetical protein [Pseudomonas phage PhiPizzaParty]WRQ05778.1 hypothetical protein IPCDMZAV_CDS0255 [Pseudomonas phage 6B]WRQ06275.1 hypothetical protein QAMIJHJT_CDS0344 [Pseudomonas phage 9-Ps-8B]WRQ06683.1 hypothetical protein FOPPYZMZ_CDS0343 [Pseudomonas phage 9Ps-7B]WRQ07034.1 hypothetical protein ZBUARNPM_CDS0285 [Pseudomonas phage 14Ps5-6]